jgi:hypothetical protein
MKKILLVLFICAQIHNSCIGQQKDEKFTAELQFGPSFPVGKFSNKSYTPFNNSSGLAIPGFDAGGKFGIRINKNFGIGIYAVQSINKQDAKSFKNYINNGSNFPPDSRVSTSPWQVTKVLAGLNYKDHFTNSKFSFVCSVMAGVFKTAIPKYEWAVYTQSGSLYNEMSHDKTSLPVSFSYQLNAGLSYDIGSHYYLLLSADYFNGAAKLHETNALYKFGTVNINAGIGVKF